VKRDLVIRYEILSRDNFVRMQERALDHSWKLVIEMVRAPMILRFEIYGLDSFPAGVLVLIVPRVDILAAGYAVAYEFRVAIVAEFKITNDPPCSRIHVCLQLYYLLRQPLSQCVQRIVGALVTAVGAWVGFYCVERTTGSVDSVMIITEDSARGFSWRQRYADARWKEYVVRPSTT
jgi:hypothetical protein